MYVHAYAHMCVHMYTYVGMGDGSVVRVMSAGAMSVMRVGMCIRAQRVRWVQWVQPAQRTRTHYARPFFARFSPLFLFFCDFFALCTFLYI